MNYIDSKDDIRILDYKNLISKSLNPICDDRFIAEGKKVILKLLKSEFEIISILSTEEFYSNHQELISSKIPLDSQFIAPKAMMNDIAGFKFHTGILAVAKFPGFVSIDELLGTIVAVNNVKDAENLGSIIRNCVAFGIESLIIDTGTYNPYCRRVARVSMGGIFSMKIACVNSLTECFKLLKNKDYDIVAVENNVNIKPKKYLDLNGKKMLIFGNETMGLDNDILENCDEMFEICMTNTIESLNVASASAILLNKLYENNNGYTI